ncbi:MAG: PqqD family protein [Anaerolineaceae bacterium]|nr:PqqD family protein [Anaerolineaceae bacterium]MCB9101422.1 PqqD family protein [Anaerolineales bacterium]
MTFANKPARTPDYQLELIDDELLLFHPGQTRILYCNATASLVWQLCDGQRTVQDIIDLLTDAYPEAEETLATDIQTSLDQFAQQGAICLL